MKSARRLLAKRNRCKGTNSIYSKRLSLQLKEGKVSSRWITSASFGYERRMHGCRVRNRKDIVSRKKEMSTTWRPAYQEEKETN